jgi:hypothetical protein
MRDYDAAVRIAQQRRDAPAYFNARLILAGNALVVLAGNERIAPIAMTVVEIASGSHLRNRDHGAVDSVRALRIAGRSHAPSDRSYAEAAHLSPQRSPRFRTSVRITEKIVPDEKMKTHHSSLARSAVVSAPRRGLSHEDRSVRESIELTRLPT